MTGNKIEAKKEVLKICQEMQTAGLVIGSAGNASFRIKDTDMVAITPSSVDYSCINADDVLVINLKGDTIEGERNPSIEHPMHLAIYMERADLNAIVHTHSVFASTLAVLGVPLPPIVDEFVVRLGGQVEVAKYGFPGSQELAQNVIAALGPRNGVLLANHGAVCCGSTMYDALHNAYLLERVAHIYLLAKATGKGTLKTLPPDAIELQQQMFEVLKKMKRRG